MISWTWPFFDSSVFNAVTSRQKYCSRRVERPLSQEPVAVLRDQFNARRRNLNLVSSMQPSQKGNHNLQSSDPHHHNLQNHHLQLLFVTPPDTSLAMSPSQFLSFISFLFLTTTIITRTTPFTPLEPLPTIFSSKSECISTYSLCMQDLAQCWLQQRYSDLSICDSFQDSCEEIYSTCGGVEIELHFGVYEMTETERCMGRYDGCLDRLEGCKSPGTSFIESDLTGKDIRDGKDTEKSEDKTAGCDGIKKECQVILNSCDNPGRVSNPRPTGTALGIYTATWSSPETFLDPSPTLINPHCLPLYHHCTTFYNTCLSTLPSPIFDLERHLKACYQILLRCKSQIISCSATSDVPLATWIPDSVAKGVEVPPWNPPGLATDDGKVESRKCLQGYHRCLVMVRDCLMAGKLLEEGGWWEKGEEYRNQCQEDLVPLCLHGVEVCKNLSGRRG